MPEKLQRHKSYVNDFYRTCSRTKLNAQPIRIFDGHFQCPRKVLGLRPDLHFTISRPTVTATSAACLNVYTIVFEQEKAHAWHFPKSVYRTGGAVLYVLFLPT